MQTSNRKSLYELIFTIVIPVFLLNKLSDKFGDQGPVYALLIALAFPIGYFIWDFISTKHISKISILGFINILLTGGFALFQLNSFWFAIKEMSIPLLIGSAILISAFTQKPLISLILSNKDIINTDLIEEKLTEYNSHDIYKEGLKKLTIYLAGTFVVSAALNYILSINIITDIPAEFTDTERLKMRNEQIADLTWKSYLIILVPSMIMLSFVLFKANQLLKKCTQLGLEQLMHQK